MQEAVVVFDDWLEYWNKKVSTYSRVWNSSTGGNSSTGETIVQKQ